MTDQRVAVPAIAAIALLAWPFASLVPGVENDWNWVAAMAMAARDGRDFGSELIWTYGPLSLVELTVLLYYSGLAVVMFAFQWVLQILLAATVFLAARRSYPTAVAIVVAFVVVTLVPDRPLVLGFAWCVLALTRPEGSPRDAMARWFPVGAGVLAGLLVLGKLNHGVEFVVLATIALATRPGRRGSDAAVFVGALLVTAGAGWLATGQTVDDIWSYARHSVDVIGGYPAAMGLTGGDWLTWRYVSAAIVFALTSLLVWYPARAATGRQRWGLVAIWLVYALLGYKAGFTRADQGHTSIFFGNVLMAAAVLPVRPAQRPLALGTLATCAVLYTIPVSLANLGDSLNPYRNAEAAVTQARTLASRDRRTDTIAGLVDRIRTTYRLPPSFVDEIADRPVAFWPHVFGDLAYAYPSLVWRPFPVVEPYSAYTPRLDRTNAELLSSGRAPERIVREWRRTTVDGRLAAFEAPTTTREILCRYREIARQAPWQLLARAPDRCGTLRPLATTTAGWGEPVPVPRPRDPRSAVLVRIDGANPRGLERIEALWLRPAARMILLDARPYRLVAATATEGLLLSAPRAADYPEPIAMAPNPATVAVSRVGGEPDGELRYEFVELPISAPATERPR